MDAQSDAVDPPENAEVRVETPEDGLERKWSDLLFEVRVSIRYHNRRTAFFDGFDKFATFLSIVFGSSAFSNVFPGWFRQLSAAIVVLFSAGKLVYGVSSKAREHTALVKRFIDLECDIRITDPTPDAFKKLCAKRLTIEADEPPTKILVVLLCMNDELLAQGKDQDELYVLCAWQDLIAHFWNWSPEIVVKRNKLPSRTWLQRLKFWQCS